MKLIYPIIFLFISSNILGQELLRNVELTEDSNTTFWFDYHFKDIEKLNLIKPDSNLNFLRISSSKYILELSPNSNRIYFYVNEVWDNAQTGESFIKSIDLQEEQVDDIESLYKDLLIQRIPSDRLIEDWQQGFDGINYILESKEGKIYSFKSYWTPSVQNHFEASKKILEFTSKLDNIVDYKGNKKEFENEIPFYGWTYNGSIVVVKVISNTKEYRKYKRAKKQQLKNNNVA